VEDYATVEDYPTVEDFFTRPNLDSALFTLMDLEMLKVLGELGEGETTGESQAEEYEDEDEDFDENEDDCIDLTLVEKLDPRLAATLQPDEEALARRALADSLSEAELTTQQFRSLIYGELSPNESAVITDIFLEQSQLPQVISWKSFLLLLLLLLLS
jgi:hypothetical protein